MHRISRISLRSAAVALASMLPAANEATPDIVQTFGADIITDLGMGHDFTSRLSLMVGASQLLNGYPGKSIASTAAGVAVGSGDSGNIFPYACIAPHGTGGRFHYVRLAGSF